MSSLIVNHPLSFAQTPRQLTGHEQSRSQDMRYPSHVSDRTMKGLDMPCQLWLCEGLVLAGESPGKQGQFGCVWIRLTNTRIRKITRNVP